MPVVRSIDGIPVVDAKHPLELHITARDCNNGDPKRPETCAAARALRREHHVIDCRVHLSRTYVRQNKGNWVRYFTPMPLQREIVSFDREGTFEPGTYQLTPPSPSAKFSRGKRQGSAPKRRSRRSGVRRARMVTKNVRTGPAYGDA